MFKSIQPDEAIRTAFLDPTNHGGHETSLTILKEHYVLLESALPILEKLQTKIKEVNKLEELGNRESADKEERNNAGTYIKKPIDYIGQLPIPLIPYAESRLKGAVKSLLHDLYFNQYALPNGELIYKMSVVGSGDDEGRRFEYEFRPDAATPQINVKIYEEDGGGKQVISLRFPPYAQDQKDYKLVIRMEAPREAVSGITALINNPDN